MPVTVNGVGTGYFGKRDLETYSAVCESCHRESRLQNYGTRLWFTVFFIPVIPLGKKQIFSDCSRCRRHRVLPAADWERIKDQSLTETQAAMDAAPSDPQPAIQLLGALQAFQRRDEALELASQLQARFATDPDTQFATGACYQKYSQFAEADRAFMSALKLQPDNLSAKRAVAAGLLRKNDPATARRLAAATPPLTARHDPGFFVELGRGFLAEGSDADALEMFSAALAAAPALGQDRAFRQSMQLAERRTGSTHTLLPSMAWHRRHPWAVLALAVLAVAGGVAAWGMYIGEHRTLHVVNGFGVPVQVELDHDRKLTIAPGGRQEVTIAEGKHEATVTANNVSLPAADFTITAGIVGRFTDHPAYVLNAGGGAVLLWEKTVYSSLPGQGPGESRCFTGTPFVAWDDVDYEFAEFPRSLSAKHGSVITKTRVTLLPIAAEQLVMAPDSIAPLGQRLALAEAHLELAPGNAKLLQAYTAAAIAGNQMDRAAKFLADGLERRPVSIPWHRFYQELCRIQGKDSGLIQQYDAFLEKSPNDSGLLYLRGRLAGSNQESLKYFDRAIASDPANAYAWFAKSYQFMAESRWAEARAAAAKASELAPSNADFASLLFETRFALGEFAELADQLRDQLRETPLDATAQDRLLQVLAAQKDLDGARTAHEEFVRVAKTDGPAGTHDSGILRSELMLLYLEQKFDALRAAAERIQDPAQKKIFVFQLDLEQGRLPEASAAITGLQTYTSMQAANNDLYLALAYLIAGDREQAQTWQGKACAVLAAGSQDDKQLVELLHTPKPTVQQLAEVTFYTPGNRCVVAVLLAAHNPAERANFLKLAEKHNFLRDFPHDLVRQGIAALRAAK